MNQHARITTQPFSGVVIFNSAEDMLTAMFGPSQHDAHVAERRRHQFLAQKNAEMDAADARVRALVASMKRGAR